MIKVKGDTGSTTTTLEYYGEAEPRLLQLREMFREKKVTRGDVISAVHKLTGAKAWEKDYDAITEGKSLLEGWKAYKDWQENNLLRVRLYGSPKVVAALVLAPEGATEVEYVREA